MIKPNDTVQIKQDYNRLGVVTAVNEKLGKVTVVRQNPLEYVTTDIQNVQKVGKSN